MSKKVIIHYVVEAQNDFVYGRLTNPFAQAAIPYVVDVFTSTLADSKSHHFYFFQRDVHPSTEAEYLKTPEGRKFPNFHCPEGDPGMEIVAELRPFLKSDKRIIDKNFTITPDFVDRLKRLAVSCTRLDEIHVYGFLTGMCVTGVALQALSNFHKTTEIFVHARGTADINETRHAEAIRLLKNNFINIIR